MAEDVLVSGGLFDITIRNAVSEASDAQTGDKVNITNMALANGLMLMWDYGERVNGQSDMIAQDLQEIGVARDVLNTMLDWTPASFEAPQAMQSVLNQLFDHNAGKSITDQATFANVAGASTPQLIWPPQTQIPGTSNPIGNWADIQTQADLFQNSVMYQSADGVYFYVEPGPTGDVLRQANREDIDLEFPNSRELVVSEADIATARRELEVSIESMTQVNQDKQAFLQDLVASLQKWFTFVNSVCDRRKRDADTIVGNFR